MDPLSLSTVQPPGPTLLRIARCALADALGVGSDLPTSGEAPAPSEPWLQEPGATFVTLRTRDGALRGCLGSLRAVRPLIDDLRQNAVAAARRDPRFPPVRAEELEDLRLEVTLLGPAEPLEVADEAEACSRLRPGVDGVILSLGPHRATFLPQVWETLPTVEAFLGHLKQKAGLTEDFWHPDLELSRYTVRKWVEP